MLAERLGDPVSNDVRLDLLSCSGYSATKNTFKTNLGWFYWFIVGQVL